VSSALKSPHNPSLNLPPGKDLSKSTTRFSQTNLLKATQQLPLGQLKQLVPIFSLCMQSLRAQLGQNALGHQFADNLQPPTGTVRLGFDDYWQAFAFQMHQNMQIHRSVSALTRACTTSELPTTRTGGVCENKGLSWLRRNHFV
jgi:hypothetical protein